MSETLDRPLRTEAKAEQIIIGELLLSSVNGDAKARTTAFAKIDSDDFADPDLGVIFDAIKALDAEGLPPEPKIVERKVRDRVKDAELLIYAATIEAVTTATMGYYCQLVAEAARERQLQLALCDATNLRTRNTAEAITTLRARLDEILPPTIESAINRFDAWEQAVINREKPQLIAHAAFGSRLKEIPIGAGLVTMFGAPPGAGKTALVMQTIVDALRMPGQEDLRALVANVEMPPESLWNRQLSRLSSVSHPWILHRDYADDAVDRIQAGIDELRGLMPRLEFMPPPYTLERLQDRAVAFAADVVVVEYAQRFDFANRSNDQRAQTNAVMDVCRRIADQGRAVIVVSAVNRAGYSKDSAGLASFRESSELEYGADSAWLLINGEQDRDAVNLKCVKNRHGQLPEIPLRFDGAYQQFRDDLTELEWKA
jgi:replicative DNA helicase